LIPLKRSKSEGKRELPDLVDRVIEALSSGCDDLHGTLTVDEDADAERFLARLLKGVDDHGDRNTEQQTQWTTAKDGFIAEFVPEGNVEALFSSSGDSSPALESYTGVPSEGSPQHGADDYNIVNLKACSGVDAARASVPNTSAHNAAGPNELPLTYVGSASMDFADTDGEEMTFVMTRSYRRQADEEPNMLGVSMCLA
jgi:hypothetical protein